MPNTELTPQNSLDQLAQLISDASYSSPELTAIHKYADGRLGKCVGLDGMVDDRTATEINDDFEALARKEIAAGELLRIGGVSASSVIELPSNVIDPRDPKYL